MGDQCGQADCEDFEGDYRRIPSLSHSSHGLVQRQTSESMEATIPSNADECNPGVSSSDRFGMGTDGRAVVEVPLRHTRIGRSEQTGMEHHSSDINDSDSVRNNSEGKLVCEKDVRKSCHCNNFHGQPTRNKVVASVSTHHGVQHPFNCYRENDGHVGALCDTDTGQRSDERSGENDRMEFDGGREIPTSI